jgi:pimeloyl-ACP methyl ester carboxylesterase
VPRVDVDGCSIRYESWSAGPPITLLHGFTSSIEQDWADRSWIDLLASSGHQVIAVDLRGHGRSAKLYRPEGYETRLLASDVLRVSDELDVESSHVVGFSMGAGVAIQLAMDAPARVRRLVICGIGDAAIRGLHDAEEVAEITEALAAHDPGAVRSALGQRIRAAADRGGNDLEALAAMTRRGGWPGDLVDPTPVDLPVLLGVAGRDDYMRRVDRLLGLLPRAEVITVPDATHTSILSEDGFKQAVLRFLRLC